MLPVSAWVPSLTPVVGVHRIIKSPSGPAQMPSTGVWSGIA